MKTNKGFTVKHQGTLLMCVAVAFVIAGGSSIVAHLVGEENHTPNQQEVTPNEEAQDQPIDSNSVQAGYYRSVSSDSTEPSASSGGGSGNYDHIVVPKRCYLVVGFDDTVPAINPSNTIVMPASLCLVLAEHALRNGGNLLNE